MGVNKYFLLSIKFVFVLFDVIFFYLFLFSAQNNFKFIMAGFFSILLVRFLSSKNKKYVVGLLCFTVAYAQLIWASLWNAVLIDYNLTTLLKSMQSIIMVYMIWKLKKTN